MTTKQILVNAKNAKSKAVMLTEERKNKILMCMADALIKNANSILGANKKDIENAKGKIGDVMIDRLMLNMSRLEAMAEGIKEVTKLKDPVGRVIDTVERPNGLKINKVSCPIGVVAVIYESRPNVTSDAAALIIKSGNVCVLRGGKEAYNSSKAIVCALKEGIETAGENPDLVNIIDDTTRESANELMKAEGYVDLLIPRGGAGLIKACVENASVPCIQTGTGICHIYVDEFANLDMAIEILYNAKTSRPSVCNACEVLLVHKNIEDAFLPMVHKKLYLDRVANNLVPVTFLCDDKSLLKLSGKLAGDGDFDTEFLDYKLAVKVVEDIDEAILHISNHSTGHSECIVTENRDNANKFTLCIDSSSVYVNASTRFTDGGEFGLGCEIGISTQKLHARGPMGLNELNTYKYVIEGNGQVR